MQNTVQYELTFLPTSVAYAWWIMQQSFRSFVFTRTAPPFLKQNGQKWLLSGNTHNRKMTFLLFTSSYDSNSPVLWSERTHTVIMVAANMLFTQGLLPAKSHPVVVSHSNFYSMSESFIGFEESPTVEPVDSIPNQKNHKASHSWSCTCIIFNSGSGPARFSRKNNTDEYKLNLTTLHKTAK